MKNKRKKLSDATVEPAIPFDDNEAGALAYLGFSAVLFFQTLPYMHRPFIRFHSAQALLLWLFFLPLHSISAVYGQLVPALGLALWPVASIWRCALLLACSLFMCARRAYANDMFRIPGLGQLAEAQA